MKSIKRITALFLCILMMLSVCACDKRSERSEKTMKEPKLLPISDQECGTAYLYGEEHANAVLLIEELNLWEKYYNEQGMRHLFVELPYYGAALLNLWMAENDDTLLDEFSDFFHFSGAGTQVTHTFYQLIKERCPETIFHGTDIGHRYDTVGEWYLEYLKNNNLTETEEYRLTINNIEQGKYYSRDGFLHDSSYREKMMAYNFARELASLDGADVMGIYGAAHIDDRSSEEQTDLTMIQKLLNEYQIDIVSEDLRNRLTDRKGIIYPVVLLPDGKYTGEYCGERIVVEAESVAAYSFWRVKNEGISIDYHEIEGMQLSGEDYPMAVTPGEVYYVQRYENRVPQPHYLLVTEEPVGDSYVTREIVLE